MSLGPARDASTHDKLSSALRRWTHAPRQLLAQGRTLCIRLKGAGMPHLRRSMNLACDLNHSSHAPLHAPITGPCQARQCWRPHPQNVLSLSSHLMNNFPSAGSPQGPAGHLWPSQQPGGPSPGAAGRCRSLGVPCPGPGRELRHPGRPGPQSGMDQASQARTSWLVHVVVWGPGGWQRQRTGNAPWECNPALGKVFHIILRPCNPQASPMGVSCARTPRSSARCTALVAWDGPDRWSAWGRAQLL